MTKAKVYRTLLLSAKLLIFGVAIFLIWYRLTAKDNNFEWSVWMNNLSARDAWLLAGVCCLMPLNWGLEAYKWRFLVRITEKISFKRAFVATLAGTTISLITPNRIGGFLGRIVFLKPENRMKASWISILGNISQLLATMVLGALAMVFLDDATYQGNTLFRWLALGATCIAVFFYWRADWWSSRLSKWKWMKKLASSAGVLSEVSPKMLNAAFGMSLLRYAVFALQFYLVLLLCKVEGSPGLLFGLIAVTYLVVSVVPSFMLGSLGIREFFVMFFFAEMGAAPDVLLGGSLLIWVINLVVPALIGGIILMVTKIKIKSTRL